MNIRIRKHDGLFIVSIEVLGEAFQGLSSTKRLAFRFAMTDALNFIRRNHWINR